MKFIKLNLDQYAELTENCTVLKTRRDKPVILLRSDGMIIKHIYHRTGWSSSRIWPYAKRFVNSSFQLHQRGIQAPIVEGLFRVPELSADIVTYPKIPGETVRELWEQGHQLPLARVAEFIAKLHECGVFFRDLHLANIVVTHNGFALLDLASVRCQHRALTSRQRTRNLKHLLNDYDDGPILSNYGINKFLAEYELHALGDAIGLAK